MELYYINFKIIGSDPNINIFWGILFDGVLSLTNISNNGICTKSCCRTNRSECNNYY